MNEINDEYPAQERERDGEKERGVLENIRERYCMMGYYYGGGVDEKVNKVQSLDALLGVEVVGTGARSVMEEVVVAMGEAMTTVVEG